LGEGRDGLCFFDLAFLTDGFDQQRLAQLFEAYRGQAEQGGLRLCGPEEMKYLVDCHRLHRIFNWIAVCVERNFPENKVTKLRGMAAEVSATSCAEDERAIYHVVEIPASGAMSARLRPPEGRARSQGDSCADAA
jgi:hypothetical protein